MVPYLGWIVLAYGMTAIIVHVMHRLQLGKSTREAARVNYVLVTHNHEKQMEWYVRALSWYGRLRGLSIHVTVLDIASDDDTLPILYRLHNQDGLELKVVGISELSEQDADIQMYKIEGDAVPVYIDLRIPEEASKLPYVHV